MTFYLLCDVKSKAKEVIEACFKGEPAWSECQLQDMQ